MKEKISIVFIVLVAVLCLFGCKDELPQDEMRDSGMDTMRVVIGVVCLPE